MNVNFSPENLVFQVFLVLVVAFWLLALALLRDNKPIRQELLWVSLWSFPGGLFVGAWHRLDFWSPASWLAYPTTTQPVFALEDSLFGFFFGGFVAVLLPLLTGKYFQGQTATRRVTRRRKVGWLLSSLVMTVVLFLTPINSVVACSGVFLFSTFIICYRRMDLRSSAILGAAFSLMAYALLVGLLLLIMPDRLQQSQGTSEFFARFGALWTGAVLIFWALSFGAWITVLYPFLADKRFATYLR